MGELGAPEYIVISSAGIFSIVIALPTMLSAALGRNIRNIKKSVISVHCIILFVTFLMGFTFTFFDLCWSMEKSTGTKVRPQSPS